MLKNRPVSNAVPAVTVDGQPVSGGSCRFSSKRGVIIRKHVAKIARKKLRYLYDCPHSGSIRTSSPTSASPQRYRTSPRPPTATRRKRLTIGPILFRASAALVRAAGKSLCGSISLGNRLKICLPNDCLVWRLSALEKPAALGNGDPVFISCQKTRQQSRPGSLSIQQSRRRLRPHSSARRWHSPQATRVKPDEAQAARNDDE